MHPNPKTAAAELDSHNRKPSEDASDPSCEWWRRCKSVWVRSYDRNFLRKKKRESRFVFELSIRRVIVDMNLVDELREETP